MNRTVISVIRLVIQCSIIIRDKRWSDKTEEIISVTSETDLVQPSTSHDVDSLTKTRK